MYFFVDMCQECVCLCVCFTSTLLTVKVKDFHDESTKAVSVHLIGTDVKVGLDVRLADGLRQLELIEQAIVRLLYLRLLVQRRDVLPQQGTVDGLLLSVKGFLGKNEP